MAKELPYFKFYVNEWITGDITFEDYESQGVFINICAYYWSKECNLSLANAKRKFKDCKPTAFESLISSKIIKVSEDGNLIINFLNEQWGARNGLSKVNSQNGKLGGRPKKEKNENKPTALKNESEPLAKKSNIEERRGEEKREDTYIRPVIFLKNENEIEFEQIQMKSNLSNFIECAEQWSLSVEGSDFAYSGDKHEDYRKLKARFEKWINTWRNNKTLKARPEKIPDLVKQGKAYIDDNGLIKPKK